MLCVSIGRGCIWDVHAGGCVSAGFVHRVCVCRWRLYRGRAESFPCSGLGLGAVWRGAGAWDLLWGALLSGHAAAVVELSRAPLSRWVGTPALDPLQPPVECGGWKE